jgi:DNA-3-methyladenine glycosylase I
MSEECWGSYGAGSQLLKKYHDEEWGRPVYDEKKLYEMFLLELFQAGLSWQIILKKRENFRRSFDHFNVKKIAAYDEDKIQELLQDPDIIRSRRKIEGAVMNARIVLSLQKEYGSFAEYLWHFTDGLPIIEDRSITKDRLSDDISADLRKRGMKFAGTVTIYSFLQAVGIVYCHAESCPCYKRDKAYRWIKHAYRPKEKPED